MDSVFGVGLPEFILILVIAGMVMGPERIVRMARTLGALTARLQNISRSFMRQLSMELDSVDETGSLRGTAEELKRLQKEVSDLRDEVFSLTAGDRTAGRKRVKRAGHESGNSIMPPAASLFKATGPTAPTASGNSTITRPPSLTPDIEKPTQSADSGSVSINRPPKLPKRIEIAEDPDA